MLKVVSSHLHMLKIDETLSLEIYKSGSSVFVNLLRREKSGTSELVSMVKIRGDHITISRSSDGPVVEVRELYGESAHVTRVLL